MLRKIILAGALFLATFLTTAVTPEQAGAQAYFGYNRPYRTYYYPTYSYYPTYTPYYSGSYYYPPTYSYYPTTTYYPSTYSYPSTYYYPSTYRSRWTGN